MEGNYYPGQGILNFMHQPGVRGWPLYIESASQRTETTPTEESRPEPAPQSRVVYAEPVENNINRGSGQLKQENESLRMEIESLKAELEFQRSIFTSHPSSAVFNLHVKKKNGQKVWVDKIKDYWELNTLDDDPEVREWLKPIRCER